MRVCNVVVLADIETIRHLKDKPESEEQDEHHDTEVVDAPGGTYNIDPAADNSASTSIHTEDQKNTV
jgi:hypothetical protein